MLKNIFLSSLALLIPLFALAQESFNTTGGNASGSGGTVSYSIGQVVYTTNTGTNGSIIQGVQQPYEISVVTGIDQAKAITLTVLAYPNPTTDYLTLSIDDNVQAKHTLLQLSFQLYDMNGKLIKSKKIKKPKTHIAMGNFVRASYLLKVSQNNTALKTFRIIKN